MTPPDVAKLVTDHWHIANQCVRKYARKVRDADRAEVESAAVCALGRAAQRWDGRIPFKHYAGSQVSLACRSAVQACNTLGKGRERRPWPRSLVVDVPCTDEGPSLIESADWWMWVMGALNLFERRVVNRMLGGENGAEIARDRGVDPRTVNHTKEGAFRKLRLAVAA